MKHILKFILKILASKLLKKHRPKIVAITGSVGKTTTKDAIFHVLSSNPEYKVLKNEGNFNNEFGLPLTILEEKPVHSAPEWISLLFRSLIKVIRSKSYYDILVLEMAADGPGDIVYLCKIAKPDIAVVTNVEKVHLLNYRSIDELAHEKSTIIHMADKEGIVILNIDNANTRKMAQIVDGRELFTFGMDKDAIVRAYDIQNTKLGLGFKINFETENIPVKLPYVIGKHNIYTILPVLPIARFFGLTHDEISKSLQTFKLPKGRMNLVEGISGSYLIDSTYNAEPASMKAAIATLKDFPEGKRRVAIVGDMLELGDMEEESHREVGKYLRETRIQVIIFVGPRMKWALDELESVRDDFPRVYFYFVDSFEASKEIAQKIKKDDVILVKGSRGMMMERIVHRLSKRIE